jgi:hypothetical protein
MMPATKLAQFVLAAALVVKGSIFLGCTQTASDGGVKGDGKSDSDGREATVLENGVATAIDGADGDQLLFQFEVPEGQTFLRIETDSDTNTSNNGVDLWVQHGKAPPPEAPAVLREVPAYPGIYPIVHKGNREEFDAPPLPGTWFVLVTFEGGVDGAKLKATWNDTRLGTQILENGGPPSQPFDVFPELGQYVYMDVPPGTNNVEFEVVEPTKFIDTIQLCASVGFPELIRPSPEICDKTGFGKVTTGIDAEGPWLVLVQSRKSSFDVRKVQVRAKFDTTPAGTASDFTLGETQTFALPEDTHKWFRVEVPEGTKQLGAKLSGPEFGDMFARPGEFPTSAIFNGWDNFLEGKDAAITIADPTPGPWFFRVRGAVNDQEASLRISAE